MTPEHVVRSMVPADRGFVTSAWFRGGYETAPACYMPRVVYDAHQRVHVDRCLATATTLVACHPDDPAELFGFVCATRRGVVPVVHWLYVRGMWRRQGFGRSLLALVAPDAPALVVTQWSKHCEWIRFRVPLFYDPFFNEAATWTSFAASP